MLDIINLDKTFVLDGQESSKKHAIDHLSLRIEEGDFITIIGSNGSGKSTLLNLIAGSIEPDEGQILLDNENIVTLKNHRRSRFIGRLALATRVLSRANSPLVSGTTSPRFDNWRAARSNDQSPKRTTPP